LSFVCPSHSAVLTGQHIWHLEEGGIFGCTLPRKFKIFPVLLEEAGYFSGWTGKGWGPGNLKAEGWGKDSPLGQCYNQKNINEDTKQGLDLLPFDYAANFSQFLRDKPKDKPFFFWCGFGEPHRGYTKGSGLNSGIKLKDADLPEHLPDTPEIRSDILDYCREIEYLDSHVARILQTIRDKGLLDNTMVIITSDQGMPFPRSKPALYDIGTHIPMVISWPKKIPGGIVVDDMVSLVDIAPTILEAADVEVPQEMNGKSLMKILFSKNSGLIDSSRDWIVTALEHHGPYRQGVVGYPCRAIQTKRYLYIWNIFPDREPSGKSEDNKYYPTRNPYPEIDPGPSKDFLI